MLAAKFSRQKTGTVYGVGAIILIMGIVVSMIEVSAHSHSDPSIKASLAITQLLTACESYQVEYRKWPQVATNAELVKTLGGDNPRKLEFLSLKPRELDAQGRYDDP